MVQVGLLKQGVYVSVCVCGGGGGEVGASTFPISFFKCLSFLHLEITLCKIVLCI